MANGFCVLRKEHVTVRKITLGDGPKDKEDQPDRRPRQCSKQNGICWGATNFEEFSGADQCHQAMEMRCLPRLPNEPHPSIPVNSNKAWKPPSISRNHNTQTSNTTCISSFTETSHYAHKGTLLVFGQSALATGRSLGCSCLRNIRPMDSILNKQETNNTQKITATS